MSEWREAAQTAKDWLALGIAAMGLVAVTGAATFFWQMVLVMR